MLGHFVEERYGDRIESPRIKEIFASAEEAEVMRRIFSNFTSGRSLHRIAVDLNTEKIPTKKGKRAGWNTSSLAEFSRTRNTQGIGFWRQQKRVRDHSPAKAKQVLAKDEQMAFFEKRSDSD